MVSAWMLPAAIVRVIEHRGWRGSSPKGAIVAYVGPTSAGVGLAHCQHGHRGDVTVQPLCGEGVRFNTTEERLQRGTAGADLNFLIQSR